MPFFLKRFCFCLLFIGMGGFCNTEAIASSDSRLTVGVTAPLSQINPFFTFNTFSANVTDVIYDHLVDIDTDNQLIPKVAKEWLVTQEGTKWTFHLRDDVFFHDGMPLTAVDVKKAFEILKNTNRLVLLSDVVKNISSIEIPTKYKVVFNLKKPDNAFPYAVRMINIAPSHLFNDKGDPLSQEYYAKPIGSGAFKVRSFDSNSLLMDANSKYYRGPPLLKEIYVRVFSNDQETLSEYIKGNLDIVFSATTENFDLVKNIDHSKIFAYKNSFLYSVFLNTSDDLLKSSKVRKALNYAINSQKIMERISAKKAKRAGSIVAPSSSFYSDEIKFYPYNPKMALSLLAEEGWILDKKTRFLVKGDKTFSFKIFVSKSDDLSNNVVRFVERDLRSIGIKVVVESKSIKELTKSVFLTKSYQGAIFHYAYTVGLVYDHIFWRNPETNQYNFTSYSNKNADKFLDGARTASTTDEISKQYALFQQAMNEDPPAIYLFWKDTPLLVHKRVKGLKSYPLSFFVSLNEVSLE